MEMNSSATDGITPIGGLKVHCITHNASIVVDPNIQNVE